MTETIPKVQKAIVCVQKGERPIVKVVNDYPVPEIKDDEVLVRLTSSGVCHSDLSFMQDHWRVPMVVKVAGHEGSGHIVKHGSKVDKKAFPLGFKVGVPLVSNPCRTCHACSLPDGEVYCGNSPYYGSFIDGTWQQYVPVNMKYIIPTPDLQDSSVVGPILCGGVTAYKALLTSAKKAGQWVVITGAGGGLGTMGIQYAKAMGLRVIAIDTGDDKKKATEALGAEVFVDFKTDNVVEKIIAATGGKGADASIMFAPVEGTYNESFEYLGLQGVLVPIGLPRKGVQIKVEPASLIFTGKKIVPSLVGTRKDAIDALDFVARGLVKPPVEVRPMEDIQEILDDMMAGKLVGRVVIDLN